jgi:hypothetical protein
MLFLLISSALAFVSGPSNLSEGENLVKVGTQLERGKVEPNENRSSFQDAEIDILKVSYVRGLKNKSIFLNPTLSLEYGSFESAEERVGSDLFYKSDTGSYVKLGLNADIVHEIDRQFGVYVQVTPVRDYNEKKFSNPRLDLFALGFTSASDITDRLYQRNLVHYGSGDSSDQNAYLAVDTGFGYRLNDFLQRVSVLSFRLFVEADTQQRFDDSYDTAFSSGEPDRIRAFKYGTVVGFDVELGKGLSLAIEYLQKLGGYDARATEVYTLDLAYKF